MAQEANKEEASRCLDIAKAKHEGGNLQAALKFGEKSLALFETHSAKIFVEKLRRETAEAPTEPETPTPARPKSRNAGSTKSSSSSSSTSRTSPSPTPESNRPGLQTRGYTKEQSDAVKRVKSSAGNYYEVLQIEKTATDGEVKKSYRKMALQFHPDKNSAPGADEAFKLISKAFTILSDGDKRAHYDRFGSDPDSRGGGGGGGMSAHGFGGNSFFGGGGQEFDEVSPEQLFNMFFGNMDLSGGRGFHSATFAGPGFRHRRFQQPRGQPARRQQRADTDAPASNFASIAQFLPLILLFLFSFLSNIGQDATSRNADPAFAFNPTSSLSTPRATYHLSVPYYVDRYSFDVYLKEGAAKLRGFEDRVETFYIRQLQQGCQRESDIRNQRIHQAKGWVFGDKKELREAERMPLPSCEKLRSFGAR